MGPTWDQQDPGGPHVGPMNFAIWVSLYPADVLPPNEDNYSLDMFSSLSLLQCMFFFTTVLWPDDVVQMAGVHVWKPCSR